MSPGGVPGREGGVSVQTFVPYADFARTAAVLDTKRLGKQRVEVIQIVRALTVPGYAWSSHPAAQGSHRSALVRKDPEHYVSAFPDADPEVSYVWPVRSEAVLERERRREEAAERRAVREQEARALSGRRRPSSRRDVPASRARARGSP